MSLKHLLELPAKELKRELRPVMSAANRDQKELVEGYMKKAHFRKRAK